MQNVIARSHDMVLNRDSANTVGSPKKLELPTMLSVDDIRNSAIVIDTNT